MFHSFLSRKYDEIWNLIYLLIFSSSFHLTYTYNKKTKKVILHYFLLLKWSAGVVNAAWAYLHISLWQYRAQHEVDKFRKKRFLFY